MKTKDFVLRAILSATIGVMKTFTQGKKQVTVIVTPEGVTGHIVRNLPKEALDGLAKKLERQLERLEAKKQVKDDHKD